MKISKEELAAAKAKKLELDAELEKLKNASRPLEVGCKVTTKRGKRIEIDKINWGEEASSACNFYRWHVMFPYEAEHAAMSHEDEIVSVEWF